MRWDFAGSASSVLLLLLERQSKHPSLLFSHPKRPKPNALRAIDPCAKMSGPDIPELDASGKLAMQRVADLVQERLHAVIEENCSNYVIPIELAKSLLVHHHDDASQTTTIPCSQLIRRWNSKPPLNVLITVLESNTHTSLQSNAVQLKGNYDSFCVNGVTELFPQGWNNSQFYEKVTKAYVELREAAVNNNKAKVASCTDDLFAALQKPGVLMLLGHRNTVQSRNSLCPDIQTLLASFQKFWRESSCSLSCGGRALTKHCHRFPSNSSAHPFWPSATGNDSVKNELALQTLYQILDHAAWINVHTLPSGNGVEMPVVEIRQEQGYGARWNAEGTEFRGFLESVSPFYEEKEEDCGRF